MSEIANLFPCKMHPRDVEFACNVIRLIVEDLRKQRHDKAADQAALWIIPFLQYLEKTP